MTFDYSIENLSENISNSKTKQYFQEVYQTFINKNYRSSTVMLYSVLVCDIVFKLRDLRDIYSDSKAEKILKEIEDMQMAKPSSSEWESKLIELVQNRTNLLESSDIVAIESLQKFRHLSAHPVLSNSDLLFSPNKETVQALIRNILEGVLTNPPFFSNKIFDTMLNDLVEVKDSVYEDESLEKYIVSRYISRLKNNDFLKVFRSLWKVVFISTDELSTTHAKLNYRTLGVFTAQRKSLCIEIIKNETNYYSNITKDFKISTMIHYLAKYPDIFSLLESPLQLIIRNQCKDGGELEFISWFLSGNIKTHFKNLNSNHIGNLPSDTFEFVSKISSDNGETQEYCDFLITYFDNNNSYDQSSSRLKETADILKKNITLKQAKELLELSNLNSQIYSSWRVPEKLKSIVSKFEDQIDKEKYENIFK